MANGKLVIKYKNSYVCEKNYNSIDFIKVPNYHGISSFSDISIFIMLLISGCINDDFSSNTSLDYYGWSMISENYFFPEYLYQVDEDTFVYDVDELLIDDILYDDIKERLYCSLNNLPDRLKLVSLEELMDIKRKYNEEKEYDDDVEYSYSFSVSMVNKDLINTLKKLNLEKSDKDVLVMYSGGKDSTLAAIRLHNEGYNVHFIHFDNGCMKDTDKPYLTYKKVFFEKDGFLFNYEDSEVNIERLFDEYFRCWKSVYGDRLEGGTLDSEIRCLSCRMAMYTKAIMIAKERGYKYIAEGARISQKFMLEQEEMIGRLKNLARQYDIELLFPVLYLESDQEEIEELLDNGYSSKTWESKCLVGRSAKDKSKQDEEVIIDYYENNIKKLVLSKI